MLINQQLIALGLPPVIIQNKSKQASYYLVFEKGIKILNKLDENGKSVIVAYPLSQNNYNLLKNKLSTPPQVITLSPRLDVVLKDRGNRKLDDEERERIKYHYQIGINSPKFGYIIDNSDLSIDDTVQAILEPLAK